MYIFLFVLCTVNHHAPYVGNCQPMMLPQRTLADCELKMKKFRAKAPIWVENPAHPYFIKETAAAIYPPLCIRNPHMNHIKKHIKGLKYKDGRNNQPPFSEDWPGKHFKAPGRYDEFIKEFVK